jgi:sugar fermentation stimulation protein A
VKFEPALKQAVLLRRYKRFLADISLPDGTVTTVHCPNTGSMTNCLVEQSPCWYSTSDNPKRKYAHTWELASTPCGHWAGINTGRANALVEEALLAGVVSELKGFDSLQREVRYGVEKSRVDFLLQFGSQPCYVEVKSVTLGEADGCGYFPDAVSERGRKHLRELAQIAQTGARAVLLYCVQHTGITCVRPADTIDPAYGRTLREAMDVGVEVIAYRAAITPEEIVLRDPLPVRVE